MIRLHSQLALLFFLFTSVSLMPPDNMKESRKVNPFSELKVYGRFHVELVKGSEESIALESEKVKLDNVLTEVDENKLKIRMKVNYFQDPEVKVIVTYKTLSEITAGAGARINAGSVEGASVIIKANSGSDINTSVTADHLETESSQGSGITLSGKVNDLDASVSTGGQLQAFELTSNTAKVKVTMGGYVKVNVKEKLDASVNMGGNISYKGMPKEVKHSTTMGGSITQMGE